MRSRVLPWGLPGVHLGPYPYFHRECIREEKESWWERGGGGGGVKEQRKGGRGKIPRGILIRKRQNENARYERRQRAFSTVQSVGASPGKKNFQDAVITQ